MRYDVFISHPQEDKAIAERFCKAFKKAGITYFCDCQDWNNDFISNQGNLSSEDTKKFRNILEPAIKDSRIIIFLANKKTFNKPLFTSLLLCVHGLREVNNKGLVLRETMEVPYDVERFFIQVTCEIPEESELINDILCELGRPHIFPEINPQKYTRQELDEIIKMGDIYYEKRKYQKAINNYHIAVACNVAEAQYKLGCVMFSRMNYYFFCKCNDDPFLKYEPCSLPNNKTLVKAAADQGCADALYKLGSMSLKYQIDDAANCFKKAAEHGHIEAQRELAKIYESEHGNKVPMNLKLSEFYYGKAAIQGDLEAQARLADLYSRHDVELYDLKKALFWYRMAAENEVSQHNNNIFLSIRAHLTLGIMFAKGIACDADKNEALRWFGLAMKKHKERDISFFWGGVYREKTGDERDEYFTDPANVFLKEHSNADEIIRWIILAASRGNIDAQFKLGQFFSYDLPKMYTGCVKKDIGKSVYWFKTAAKNGHNESQYKMGCFYKYGVIDDNRVLVRRNHSVAARWYRKSAEQGNPEAQFSLGDIYACGKGVKRNVMEASEWYRKAANNGHWEASKELATMYYNGNGVKCNYSEAEYWYLEAAKRGSSNSQYYLAERYWQGDFGTNLTKAIRWYRIAADKGNDKAQNTLGVYYQSGIAVVKDTEQAMFWFRKAAESGYALAQRNLAMMIAKGKGSRKKKAEAIEWLRKAAKQGDEVAIKELPRFEHLYGSTIPQSDNLK